MLASYATAVALNSFLPANIGTWVMLLMFTTLFVGATFTMMLSGIVVQKIPFTVFNVALYLYLFLSVAGSFSIKLGFLSDHTGLVVMIASERSSCSSCWGGSSGSAWRDCARRSPKAARSCAPRAASSSTSRCPSSAATPPGSASSPSSSAPTGSRSPSTTSPP